jgi:hypothetical protein
VRNTALDATRRGPFCSHRLFSGLKSTTLPRLPFSSGLLPIPTTSQLATSCWTFLRRSAIASPPSSCTVYRSFWAS